MCVCVCVGGVCEGVECGGLSLCLLHSSPLSLLLSPLSLFLAHYPLRQQTSPWAAVKRTVLCRSHRQPQPERCPALLILINTHTHTHTHTHAPSSSRTRSPQRAPLTDRLVGSRLFSWPSLANETSNLLEKQARDRILEKFYWEETLFLLYGLQ